MSRRILVVALSAAMSVALLAACTAIDRQEADDAADDVATEVDNADDAVADDTDDIADEQTIDVVLTDHEIAMETTAQAGDIAFEVTNEGDVPHGIAIQEGTDGEGEFLYSLSLDPGESGMLEANLDAGDYTIFCPMSDHRDEHGMELEFTVEDDDAVVDDDEVAEDAYDVTLSDHEIDMPEEVSAGDVTFDVSNDGETPHGIAFQDEDGEIIAATTVGPGETGTLDVSLEEGTYTVFCPVGEHREDYDMEVELTVAADGGVVDDVDDAVGDDDYAVAEESVDVTLTDHEIDMPEEVAAGDITFEVTNDGESRHGLAFQELDEDGEPGDFVASITVSDGDSETLEVTLEEGNYIVFCPIGEHRDDYDMEVELTVTGEATLDDDDDEGVDDDDAVTDDDAVVDEDDDAVADIAESPVDVTLLDFEIEMPETIAAGEVTFEITNDGEGTHGFTIKEVMPANDDDDEDAAKGVEAIQGTAVVNAGETEEIDVILEEGEYIVYCQIGEHREAQGMEVEITVE